METNDKLLERINLALSEARLRAEKGLQKEMLLTVLTETDTLYFETDPLKPAEEAEAVLAALKKTPKIVGVICLWKNGQLDMISAALREGLLALDPANAEARIVLQGENGLNARKLSACC